MAAAFGVFAVALPFAWVTYPPLTDFPFHAAQTSILANYRDPSFHFQDQFELQPLAVPYLSSYALGGLFMLVLPPIAATKLASVILLVCVPAGVATLCWGMQKSPLLGLAALPVVWGSLTHWGFVHFVAAIGLFAAALGLTLRLFDQPSRRVSVALGAVLCALHFTHVFRVPFALLAALLAALLTMRRPAELRRLLAPLSLPTLLFATFWWRRPRALEQEQLELGLHRDRMGAFFDFVVGSFRDPREIELAKAHLWLLAAVALASVLIGWSRRQPWDRFRRRATAAVALAVLGLFLGYWVLPMEIGSWWYVFPREATATLVIALALLPDLPRAFGPRAVLAGLLIVSAASTDRLVLRHWSAFDDSLRDFHAIKESLPQAPRLLYLVFDHAGSTRTTTPYLHVPAYVQAERGGWLSFQFASFGASPVKYRSDAGAVVPPPVPRRWEWTPHKFKVREHGRFFDWFLIRDRHDPHRWLAADPSIVLVRREGTFWLFTRRVTP